MNIEGIISGTQSLSGNLVERGPQGPIGPQGPAGPVGPQGPQGKDGNNGASGVYIGEKEPTDEDISVWIDTDGGSDGTGGGGITNEIDPTVPQHVKNITENDIEKWNSGTGIVGQGLTTSQINALHEMFKACAYVKEDISTEYETFKLAFGIDGGQTPDEPIEPEVTLVSISASYTGGNVTVGTSLNSLTGITVKAHYSDGSTKNISGYTLSGTIVEGNNTIIVSYEGLTTTFVVVGVAKAPEEDTTLDNLMTTGEMGIFSDLGVYTAYTGYYNAEAKTLQLTVRSNSASVNAHLKLTPFVEMGKSYTLFVGVENRTNAANTIAVDYCKANEFQANYLTNNKTSKYVQFTVPEDMVEIYLKYTTKERIDTTVTNVALYEGTLTEMP